MDVSHNRRPIGRSQLDMSDRDTLRGNGRDIRDTLKQERYHDRWRCHMVSVRHPRHRPDLLSEYHGVCRAVLLDDVGKRECCRVRERRCNLDSDLDHSGRLRHERYTNLLRERQPLRGCRRVVSHNSSGEQRSCGPCHHERRLHLVEPIRVRQYSCRSAQRELSNDNPM